MRVCVCVREITSSAIIHLWSTVENRERALSGEILQIRESRQQQGNSACNIRDLLKGTVTALNEKDCPALEVFLS